MEDSILTQVFSALNQNEQLSTVTIVKYRGGRNMSYKKYFKKYEI